MKKENSFANLRISFPFQLCGIALVVVGAGFLLRYDEILDAFKEVNVNVAPIALIVVGSTILVISFFGCCGAIRESHCMVATVSFANCAIQHFPSFRSTHTLTRVPGPIRMPAQPAHSVEHIIRARKSKHAILR